MPEIKDINLRIKVYRSLAGLTQAEVAKELGMKRNTYGRMELHGNPRPEILIKLAALFNVSVETLLFGYDTEKTNSAPENAADTADPIRPDDLNAKRTSVYFKEDVKPELSSPVFIPTNSEINLIKAYRLIPKDKKQQLREFLEQLYHESK